LSYGGIEFEDDRTKRVDFGPIKTGEGPYELPFGQFPVLHVSGRPYSQSYAIAKYAAKLAGLMPASMEDQLACDMIILSTEDVRSKLIPIRYSGVVGEARLAKYRSFYEEILPGLLANFSKLLGDEEFFVGGKISIADVTVLNMFLYLTFPACEVQAASEEAKQTQLECLDKYPNLVALKARIESVPSIATWLQNRPVTAHDNVMTLETPGNL
jgi:glutathione S-transferase